MKIIPRLRRNEDRGKITIYPPREIAEIYHMGKGNGWDTPKLVRDAVTKILSEMRQALATQVDKAK